MTPKEITTLAGHRLLPPWVMKLALDVAAAEREACAKVCDSVLGDNNVSAAIRERSANTRARGEK